MPAPRLQEEESSGNHGKQCRFLKTISIPTRGVGGDELVGNLNYMPE